MNKYRILAMDNIEFLATYEEAKEYAEQFVESTGKETCVVEVISIHKPVIDSYEAAKTYLGEGAKNHQKALIALDKLIVIAEAWNKQDGFVPDFDNTNQYKWFPWFKYDHHTAGFVFSHATYTAKYANAAFGSRLCFKSPERAEQFGKQFIDPWNDFLLYR